MVVRLQHAIFETYCASCCWIWFCLHSLKAATQDLVSELHAHLDPRRSAVTASYWLVLNHWLCGLCTARHKFRFFTWATQSSWVCQAQSLSQLNTWDRHDLASFPDPSLCKRSGNEATGRLWSSWNRTKHCLFNINMYTTSECETFGGEPELLLYIALAAGIC